MEKVKVYRLGQDPVELDRDRIVFTQRSAIVMDCDRERWLGYHGGPRGTGVTGALIPDDLVLGSAVHAGMEWMMGVELEEDRLDTPMDTARNYFLDKRGSLLLAEYPDLEEASPELYEEVLYEQAYLAQGLVWTFSRRILPRFLEQYEVVSLEEEINWEVGQLDDGRTLVMMSRSDGVVRGRTDGKLYAVSHKTIKQMWGDTVKKLGIDPQQWTEGLAVQARYGEELAGTLYFYFLKGRREAENGIKRYQNGMVRPWLDQRAIGGTPNPGHFAMVGKWNGKDGAKGGALGSGWDRVNVWEHLDFGEWLEWLDAGYVQPALGRDWLGEMIAEPMVEPWNGERAEEFRQATIWTEGDWIRNVERLAREDVPGTRRAKMTVYVPKRPTQCHRFGNRQCQFYDTCWGDDSIEAGMVRGRWTERIPNHEIERGGEE